jgi:molybdopterin molybdotransferase
VALLHPDQALQHIEAVTHDPRTEPVALEEALGRALAEEVRAPEDSPPFAKAAMDGYAVSSSDPGPSFRLVATLAAGEVPARPLGRGECVKIMTGAMMPPGADKVLRVEFTRERDGVVTLRQEEPYANLIARGENLKAGDRVLGPQVLKPRDIGVLASLGLARVRVAVRPAVGVLATGSELRNPGESLGPGEIYNSNGLQLCAQVAASGGEPRYYGIVSDEPARMREAVMRALGECDLLLLSGGVSMGELDFVPGVLQDCGAEILFHKLAIKPGKPTLFARRFREEGQGEAQTAYIFGLPGNPVSAYVIFEVLVRPLLYRLLGLSYRPRMVAARLAEAVKRRDAERVEFRPVRLEGGGVQALSYHGSAHLNALSEADALLRLDAGVLSLEEGSQVHVRLL